MTVQRQGDMKKGKVSTAVAGRVPKRKGPSSVLLGASRQSQGGTVTVAPARIASDFPLESRAKTPDYKTAHPALRFPSAQRLLIKARKTGLMNYTNRCPKCDYQLKGNYVHVGFSPHWDDISTKCPACDVRFVPTFTVGGHSMRDCLSFTWLFRNQTYTAWERFLASYKDFIKGDPTHIIDVLLYSDPCLAWNIMEWAPDTCETLPDAINALFCTAGILSPLMRSFKIQYPKINKHWKRSTAEDWLDVPMDALDSLARVMGVVILPESTLGQVMEEVEEKPECGPVAPLEQKPEPEDSTSDQPSPTTRRAAHKKVKLGPGENDDDDDLFAQYHRNRAEYDAALYARMRE